MDNELKIGSRVVVINESSLHFQKFLGMVGEIVRFANDIEPYCVEVSFTLVEDKVLYRTSQLLPLNTQLAKAIYENVNTNNNK